MEGILKSLSIQSYGLFDKQGKLFYRFTVLNTNARKKIDLKQGKVVNFNQDIKNLL